MSTLSRTAGAADPPHVVSVELVDAVVEAVVFASGPQARAAVLQRLVGEMCAAVDWLHGQESAPDEAIERELVSVAQLAAAALDHDRRMTDLCEGRAGDDVR